MAYNPTEHDKNTKNGAEPQADSGLGLLGDEKNSDRAQAIAEEAEALGPIHNTAETEGEDAARKAVHAAALEEEQIALFAGDTRKSLQQRGALAAREAIENAKEEARANKKDTAWDLLLAQQQYWQAEFETYDGYVNALNDYQQRLANGEIFTEDTLPPEVKAAFDAYKKANPDAKVDLNDPVAVRKVQDWAIGKRDYANTQVREHNTAIKIQAQEHNKHLIKPSTAAAQADAKSADEQEHSCRGEFNNCAVGKEELKPEVAATRETVVNNDYSAFITPGS